MKLHVRASSILFAAIALSVCIGGCGQDDGASEGPESKPVPRKIVPVEPSEKLEYWLSTPATHWQISDDTAQEFAEDMNSSLLFGDEGLKMEVAPGVKGAISGTWTQVEHRDFLDEVCEKNNWRWDIIEPNTILISPK
jgi:hypothetical protein